MEDQGIYKKTLLTVAAMLAAWAVLVGSLTLVTLLVVRAAPAPDTEGAKVEAPGAPGVHPEPKVESKSGTKNHLMKSATQI